MQPGEHDRDIERLGDHIRDPAIGEVGREERVLELRVETVVPVDRVESVVQALRAAHPYEEPAFELYAIVDVQR